MRRSSPQSIQVGQEQREVTARLEGLDPERVIAALEPYATPARRARLQGVFAQRIDAVTVLTDKLYDPHNGAAVLRSCDAFGVGVVHAVEKPAQPLLSTRGVSRGAERWVEVRASEHLDEVVAAVRARGHELVATHPEGELAPADLGLLPRVCLVIGNERDGIRDELRAHCSRSVRVPMRGFVESLNLSVTTAILLAYATSGRPGDLSLAAQRALYARALYASLARAEELLDAAGVRA